MPHIVIEYSANLERFADMRAVVDGVHQAVLATGAFEIGAIRTRAARRDIFRVADGDPDNAFVHVELRIGPGREIAVQQAVSAAVMRVLQKETEAYARSCGLGLSVEIRQIDNASAVRVNNLHERMKLKAANAAAGETKP